MEDNIHKGHRQRMRAKLTAHGHRVFDTYELLEMLLYRTVSRRDTNPLAKQLLKGFSSLDGVLGASVDELVKSDGIGQRSATLISLVGEAYDFAKRDCAPCVTFDDYDMLGEYFIEYFKDSEAYRVAIMTLDNNMRMIKTETLYELDYASGGVKPKPFIDRIVKDSAAVAVIAHCHPNGPCIPSPGDRATNLLIEKALNELGVTLIEHYIVTKSRYLGFMTLSARPLLEQRPALEKFIRSKGE